jgi:glycosyltransferase involved in cell wall biosynthesis
MRVGLSIRTVYDSQGNPRQKDGIGVYTENILKSLSNQKQQHDIEIIPCYQKNINELLQKTSNKYKSLTNIFMKGLLPNIPWYKKLENDIDIYHSTDYIIPKLKDTPVIATLHDAIMFKDKTMSNKKYRKLKNFLLKKHAKFADHIITLSQTVKQDIVEYWGIPEKKISVIYYFMVRFRVI